MAELQVARSRPAIALPAGMELVPASIVCTRCKRAWRWPQDDVLTLENQQYLAEHVEDHVRSTRKRRPQAFPAGARVSPQPTE